MRAEKEFGIEWLTDLCNDILAEGKIPSDWKRSALVPVYKGEGDPLECGSYRAIKLLEQAMKVVEWVLANRIRQQVGVDEMQFGFTKGKGTTDAIFIVGQMQKKPYYAFVDMVKAFDRVPKVVTRWVSRKAGVVEWLVSAIMEMYDVVRSMDGDSNSFEVKVGLHQGSVLSPLLFIIVMDVVPGWTTMYADDLVLMAKSEQK